MSSPTPLALPFEIHRFAQRGELQKVVKWLRKGGPIDALRSATTEGGKTSTETLLHAAAANDHLELVRVLLKRGASVDLQSVLGCTALMVAAYYGHPSTVRILLQHSADPDLQSVSGQTTLMHAAEQGQVGLRLLHQGG